MHSLILASSKLVQGWVLVARVRQLLVSIPGPGHFSTQAPDIF